MSEDERRMEAAPSVLRSVTGPGGGRIRTIEEAPKYIPGTHAGRSTCVSVARAMKRYNRNRSSLNEEKLVMLQEFMDGNVHYFLGGANGFAPGARFDEVRDKFFVRKDRTSVSWTAFARAVLEVPIDGETRGS